MTEYYRYETGEGKCQVDIARFTPENGGGDEIHAYIRPVSTYDGVHYAGFEEQLGDVVDAYNALSRDLDGMKPVMKRWFLSDIANQAMLLPDDSRCAMSVVGQPPLMGGKVVLWVYFRSGVVVSEKDGLFEVDDSNGQVEYWCGSYCVAGETDSLKATDRVLRSYIGALERVGLDFADSCHRTWFFVRDIDVNYKGMVLARNNVFDEVGLVSDTHYIASTGIAGAMENGGVVVSMDAYAASGCVWPAVRYLYAPENLNRTSDYGVAFERGVRLDFPGRSLVFISGTASIDNRGAIVCGGDVVGQTRRMIENIDALLAEAGCRRSDLLQGVVYLRDTADAAVVDAIISHEFPGLPYVVVMAAVCRPGWLVEMECMGGL